MDIYDSKMIRCQNCGREYNVTRLKKCPICAVAGATPQNPAAPSAPDSSNQVSRQAAPVADSTLDFLQEVIYAQNRTTHAVRALVRFLFIQLSTITIAWFINTLAKNSVNAYECQTQGTSCSPNGFLSIISVVVWIVGLIVSSNIGWKELNSSDIPGEHSGNPYRY